MRHHLVSALPVWSRREQIVDTVRENRVTIVTAETGAGKSILGPILLAEDGFRVVVTQPRRLAARTLAQRVAHIMETPVGDRVGYATAEERRASAATEILYCTDGLQLVRELSGAGQTGGRTVLVLDEVHEWNTNMEVLVAWTRQRIEHGDDLRVVLMSATLDAERLSSYFGGAPVISVEGRLFPVEKRTASSYALTDQAEGLAKSGHNVLVFQPGKREIAETVSALESRLGGSAVVLPLHGSLSPEEQQRCFDTPPTGKVKVVVSTNVAQTSVTIPDIDAVVDSGVERRIELVDGIEGLYLKPTSQADCLQRAGRAGRVKPGVCVLCSDTSMAERLDFPKAEVLRSRLDQVVLRLAVQGFDATALKFFHQPDETVLAEAKRALVALGAMSSDGSVTKIGRRMARFPVSVGFARMLIEAERSGVVEQVATIAACLEAGDIRARDGKWKSLTQDRRSDLLAVLDVYEAARMIKGGGGRSKASALRDAGIFAKDFFRAGDIRRKLLSATGKRLRAEPKSFGSRDEEREAILRACVAGMVDHLYQSDGYGSYRNGGNGTRELARESVVSGQPQWLVGLPFDISGKNRRGRTFVLKLVGMATEVDPTWLVQVAPHLASEKAGLNPRYDAQQDVVVSTTQTFFNGQMVQEETVADGEHPEAAKVFARWLSAQSGLPTVPGHSAGQVLESVLRSNAARQGRARKLNTRTGESTFQVFSSGEVFERFVAALSGARRVLEVVRPEDLGLPTLDEDTVASVLRENPDTISVLGSDLVVEYVDSYGCRRANPRVELSDEAVKANSWIRLPDKGLRLPGGRSVGVVVRFGHYDTYADTSIPQLKAKVREYLNREQWDCWDDRPEVGVPSPKDEGSAVPFVVAVYGQCIATGTDLKAYGTCRAQYGEFRGAWYRDLCEAQEACHASCLQLDELKAEACKQAELDELRRQAVAAREELKVVQSHDDWYDLDQELCRKAQVRTGYHSRLPHEAGELREWTAETKAIIAEARVALAELRRKRQDEARARAKVEQEKRVTLADLLAHDWVRDELGFAERIDAFVDEAFEIRGAKDAARILREESYEAYGRARRTDAVYGQFPGINCQGLDWAAGRDIEAVAFWAESKLDKSKGNGKKVAKKSESKVPTGPALTGDAFVDGLAALKAKFNK